MGHGDIWTPGQRQLKYVHEPAPGPTIAEELGLGRGDIIEIDDVLDPTVAFEYRLRSGTRCIIVPNDEYFAGLEDLKEREAMMVNDPKHMIAVSDMNEPFGLMVLRRKQVSWRKVPRRSTDIRWA